MSFTLTKKHIGKKVTGHGLLWFIPFEIKKEQNGDIIYVYGVRKYADGDSISETKWKDRNGIDINDWEFYKEPEIIKEVFDFAKFGCNEKHVRDLVKALDKRYNYKGE